MCDSEVAGKLARELARALAERGVATAGEEDVLPSAWSDAELLRAAGEEVFREQLIGALRRELIGPAWYSAGVLFPLSQPIIEVEDTSAADQPDEEPEGSLADIVEDEPGLVMTLTDRLVSEGYAVESARTAQEGLAQATSGRFDVILDTAGNRRLSHLRRALSPRGTLVLIGGEGGGRWVGGFDRQLRAVALSPFVRQRLRMLISTEDNADLRALRDLLEAGTVVPLIDRTYPLEQIAEAHRYVDTGYKKGNVIITMEHSV